MASTPHPVRRRPPSTVVDARSNPSHHGFPRDENYSILPPLRVSHILASSSSSVPHIARARGGRHRRPRRPSPAKRTNEENRTRTRDASKPAPLAVALPGRRASTETFTRALNAAVLVAVTANILRSGRDCEWRMRRRGTRASMTGRSRCRSPRAFAYPTTD